MSRRSTSCKTVPSPQWCLGCSWFLDFSLGLCLNTVLIFTVFTCPVLRRVSFNRILLHLCVICALDCVLNLLGSVAFVAVTHLDVSQEHTSLMSMACRVNAALTQWTTAIQSVTLAVLAMDRVMTLYQPEDPKTDPRNRLMKMLPAITWVYGTALVAPIIATSRIVGVRPFPDRYSCGVIPTSEDSKELLYPSLLLILGYILPWIVIVIILTIIIRHVISTRRRQQQLEEAALQRSQGRSSLVGIGTSMLLHSTSHQTSWSNWLGGPSPLSSEEVKFYFLSCMLLVFYFIFLVPHILCVNIPSLTAMPASQDSKIPSNNSMSEKTPELTPILTGAYDCVFIWCRYSFIILVPILIIAIHKEVRKKCEHMFCCCCCHNNSVVHLDNARSISACVEKSAPVSDQTTSDQKNKQVSKKRNLSKKDKYKRIAHYRTPVLFATAEGLHLRLVDDKLQDSCNLNETDIGGRGVAGGKEQCWTVEPLFLCEFCDVALIASAPTESIGNAGLHQSFGASMRRGRPPVFGGETLAEEDLHVSDSSGEFASKAARKRNGSEDPLEARNYRNVSINNNRKVPRVRFAQTINEIPLSESGVWSSPEDQGILEQSVLHKKNEPPDIALNELKPNPKINTPSRSHINKSS